ncbi:uncharacterized protein LOC123671206 [Harmonia axyridis]|uniref:uncharacterized protein LOC123671206 n=1 Tax=Harmonia axyridis TaxID=115357 RepID=UPI001E2764DC|nr:uncharacterized protein LOC123671206 [Harmonia axyridis]
MSPVVLSTVIRGSDEFEVFPLRQTKQNIVIRQKKSLKGPSRVVRLCLLGVILPIMLIAIPLYVRHRIYRHQLYPLTISDMRIIDGRISTTWCQRQVLRANTTFNAFLLPETPTISGKLEHFSMVRHLLLEDDMKEYWGFYLLKGSVVKVSTCVRWPGASLIVIRGHKHLHECAYIGDNSSEEADETEPKDDGPANKPKEMRRHRPEVQFFQPGRNEAFVSNESLIRDLQEVSNDDISDSDGDIKEILANLQNKTREATQFYMKEKSNRHGHRNSTIDNGEIKNFNITSPTSFKNITSEEMVEDILLKLEKLGAKSKNIMDKLNKKYNTAKHGTKRKREIFLETASDLTHPTEEHENIAIEEGFQPDGIADHRGRVLEMETNDMSNSEFWSSFSSSEEALLSCTGLILNLPLTPHHKCSSDLTNEEAEETYLMNTISYKVPMNAYYFFVFNSENEVQQNYLRVTFNLEKKVYNVSNPLAMCSNATKNCSLDLKFLSQQKVVLQLPHNNEEIPPNMEFVAESECEPRSMLYAFFVISVPVVFILFAFI